MRNDGTESEDIFDRAWFLLGKRAYVYEFEDAKKATGRNRRVVGIKNQPSDRIVTFDGETFYAEVKSTIEERRFPFSLLRATQGAYARMIVAAGGRYDIFLHSLAHDRWYRVPYAVVKAVSEAGTKSMTWAELEPYSWSFPAVV
jgi:penicillin-binding protein-related factor A (putative recombinase)